MGNSFGNDTCPLDERAEVSCNPVNKTRNVVRPTSTNSGDDEKVLYTFEGSVSEDKRTPSSHNDSAKDAIDLSEKHESGTVA